MKTQLASILLVFVALAAVLAPIAPTGWKLP